MTLCPIAVAAACRKGSPFAVCPLQGVIGGYRKEESPPKAAASAPSGAAFATPKASWAKARD